MTSIRAAAVISWLNGVGFGIFIPSAIWNLAHDRPVPIVFGFPAYGGGFFERHGIKTSIPLLSAFLAVCVLEVVAGALLWAGLRSGAILGFATIPVGAIFWLGFDLPVPPVFAILRAALMAVGWKSLH
jgi:hypothetical protein